jgi:hypothetical protein
MRISPLVAVVALVVLTNLNASAQTQAVAPGPPDTIDAQRIIRSFTTKEAEFRRALNSYSFKRDA